MLRPRLIGAQAQRLLLGLLQDVRKPGAHLRTACDRRPLPGGYQLIYDLPDILLADTVQGQHLSGHPGVNFFQPDKKMLRPDVGVPELSCHSLCNFQYFLCLFGIVHVLSGKKNLLLFPLLSPFSRLCRIFLPKRTRRKSHPQAHALLPWI